MTQRKNPTEPTDGYDVFLGALVIVLMLGFIIFTVVLWRS